MTRIAFVNGRYIRHEQAAVHIEDRGFQFADSIYEVCALVEGKFIDERAHYDRLLRSLAAIEIQVPLSYAALGIIFRELVRKNRIRSGIVYCQITRGQARREHFFPNPQPLPTVVITAKRVPPQKLQARRDTGIAVITRPDDRWARCNIKSTGLLANVLAKQAARVGGADEAWLVDSAGDVTEGTSTNAWIVTEDGTLVTRPLGNQILGGVTRAALIECAKGAALPFEERKFSIGEAMRAAEAFSSASTVGALPVISIDGVQISGGKPGPVTQKMNALYASRTEIVT
ncbi:MAG: D-amino-acid transaminase [Rhodobiaceae bacterium]|nr:D-amino-acid transaminase [Rhodobiaceae bacterium]